MMTCGEEETILREYLEELYPDLHDEWIKKGIGLKGFFKEKGINFNVVLLGRIFDPMTLKVESCVFMCVENRRKGGAV